MRYIRYIFLILVGLCLILVALANRNVVTLRLMPEELAGIFQLPNAISIPLFVVIFLGVLIGLLIGFVWEYLREFKYRHDLSKKGREVNKLEREVKTLRAKNGDDKDDVLALID